MFAPPVPPFFEHVGQRPFAFRPAIQNIPHNKWFYRKATWTEVLVENARTHKEIWIPRRYLGEVSLLDEPVMIVSLLAKLEFDAGRVLPAQRRVIEMPHAVHDALRQQGSDPGRVSPAPVIGIRIENEAKPALLRMIVGGISAGMLGCVLLVSIYRGGILGNKLTNAPALRSVLGLGPLDGYNSVLRLLGPPDAERWRNGSTGGYGQLAYSRKGLYIILKGDDRESARYVGALDRDWTPVHVVALPSLGSSYSLLKNLPRF